MRNASLLMTQGQKAVSVHGHLVRQTLPRGSGMWMDRASVNIDRVPEGS